MEPCPLPPRLMNMRVHRMLLAAAVPALLIACGAPVPGTTEDRSGIVGEVHLGPQCPVETQDDLCPQKPVAGVRVTVAERLPGGAHAAGGVVTVTRTGVDGTYRVAVAPGSYVVTADAGMSCDLVDAEVAAGAYVTVDVPCDTGMR